MELKGRRRVACAVKSFVRDTGAPYPAGTYAGNPTVVFARTPNLRPGQTGMRFSGRRKYDTPRRRSLELPRQRVYEPLQAASPVATG